MRFKALSCGFLILAGISGMASANDDTGTRTIEISAQPLGQALRAFAEQTGLQLAFEASLTEGRTSPEVKGQLSTDHALEKLLEGTGLRYDYLDSRTVAVSSAGKSARLEQRGSFRLVQAETGTVTPSPETELQEIVVEASKIGSSVVTTPQSVSVISSADIERRGAQSMNDVLRYVPGTVADSGGYEGRGDERMLLRGFSGYGTANYRDGLRQAGGWFAVPVTEIYNIEQVEVLRGPSSALFGQSDVGGIINRVTKRPGANVKSELVAEFGTFDRKQIAADLGGALNGAETLHYRVVSLALDTDNQGRYSNGVRPSNRAFFVAPSVLWKPSERTSLLVQADFRRNHQKGYSYSTAASDGSYTDILVGDPDFTRTHLRQGSVGYQLQHFINDNWAVHQNFRFSHIDADVNDVYDAGFDADGHTLNRSAIRDEDWLDQALLDTQLRGEFQAGGVRQTVLVGVDLSRVHWNLNYYTGAAPSLDLLNPIYGESIDEPSTILIDRTTRTELAGMYAQHRSRFGEHRILTLGSRYDGARVTTDNNLAASSTRQRDHALTNRVGLSYVAANGFAPYLSYAESFLPQAGTDFAGTPFEPTRGRQYEAGVKFQPAGFKGLFTAALFDITKTNVQTADRDHYGFRDTTGEVTSRGVELEGSIELLDGLNLAATYSYVDVEVTRSVDGNQGKMPIQVPRNTASLWLDYAAFPGALQGLSLSGGMRYVGQRYDDALNTAYSPAYTLFDLGVRYERGPWQYALNGVNVFDKSYFQSRAFGYYFWGYERTVAATVKYRW